MAFEHCPITTQLILELVKRLDGSSLYDDLVEEIEEVQELAEGSKPDESALALRAFYLLEVMYHVLLPKMVIPRLDNPRGLEKVGRASRTTTLNAMADANEFVQQVQQWRFARSREGLTELLKLLQEVSDDTEVDDYALALDGSVTPELRNLRHTQALPLHGVLLLALQFATTLRKALNPNNQTGWRYFGTCFTSAWLVANQDESELLEHASRLPRIYTNTAMTPWNPTKNSQD
jgi:hypothetical protein